MLGCLVVALLSVSYGVSSAQTYVLMVDQVLNGSEDTLHVAVSVAQTGAPTSGAGVLRSGTVDFLYDPTVWRYGYSQSASGTNTGPVFDTFPRIDGAFGTTYGPTAFCTSPPCSTEGASSLSVTPSRGNPTVTAGNEADVCSPATGACTVPVVRLTLTQVDVTNPVIVGASPVLLVTHAFTKPAAPPTSPELSPDEARSALAKMAVSGTNILVDSTSLVLCYANDIATGSVSCCDGRGTGLAGFCIVNNVQPNLPVELSSFEVIQATDALVLNWGTASEDNNAGFSVEHARGDDEGWSELAFIDGHGTTIKAQAYTYSATGLDVGSHRFRLRQIDFDGAFEYSEVLETTIELAGTHRLGAAYPNPFNPSTNFELIVGREQTVQIEIVNALGQRVQRLFDGPMEANEPRNFVFEAHMLPTGLYFYRVVGENFAQTRQMLLVK
jgi:hypothetical protein